MQGHRDKMFLATKFCVADGHLPNETPVAKIIEAIDGPEFMQGCFLGLPVCDATNPCVMHDSWTAARTRMREEFAQISLADLSARLPAAKSAVS
mgnify:CR=1 FL=1